MSFNANRLVVLGGSSGIGKAVWERFRGRDLFRMGMINYGEEDFDVTRGTELVEALTLQRPTDLVYSVGINRLDWIKDMEQADFMRLMEVNVWGFLRTIQVLDQLGCQDVNVVAVTSDAAWRPMRTSAAYCASKAAMEMAVRVASREYAPRGWRINAVAPGKVADTPMTEYVDSKVPELRGWSPEFAEEYERNSSPLGRKVRASEVARVIEQVLFGPEAQTGEIIAVNGGR